MEIKRLEYFREYRAKNREKLRAYTRKYNNNWRHLNGYACEERAKEKFPEKHRARQLLHYAIKKGDIIRLPCEVCGNVRSQGHHEDYTKPYDVNWLCALHHTEKHRSSLSTLQSDK